MTKFLLRCGALTLLALPLPLLAQSWSVAGGVGPFAFGKFAERTVRASTGQGAVRAHPILCPA